ncbi:MAG: hypothetical protein CVT63_04095 [Candidatus Anoxymicrobium japonicum]|uniref:SHSP domain-containing protein n=1 Tax=Candidatus Anoxymicrobium japonicum TaxID=2013648 RepID=A0A2N3G643_9ACTN|nr:MAG: hypothetical protein CVT63_04095 [Candidatus Anoxymicrobium japonicum]
MEEEVCLMAPEDIQSELVLFFEHLDRWKRPVFFFEKAWQPLCDVSETAEEVIVVVDLAGVESENVRVSVHGEYLCVNGIRREPPTVPRRRYHRMEINYGIFEREVPLPSRVDAGAAKAVYVDGFMEIRLPKVPKAPSGEVEIDVDT